MWFCTRTDFSTVFTSKKCINDSMALPRCAISEHDWFSKQKISYFLFRKNVSTFSLVKLMFSRFLFVRQRIVCIRKMLRMYHDTHHSISYKCIISNYCYSVNSS